MAQPEESRGISRRPRILDLLGSGSAPEVQARDDAEAVVRAARGETSRTIEGSAPDPEEVRERRESRVRRETHQES